MDLGPEWRPLAAVQLFAAEEKKVGKEWRYKLLEIGFTYSY